MINKNQIEGVFYIAAIVCGIKKEQINSKLRFTEIVNAKILIANFLRENFKLKEYSIANLVERDESSISHYKRRHSELLQFDKKFKAQFEIFNDLCQNLLSGNVHEIKEKIIEFRKKNYIDVDNLSDFLKLISCKSTL